MKKVVILNGSPRKNFNTATLLKEAQRGAEDAGAQVEFVHLYDLNYKGCVSCLVCKRKGNTTNGLCFYKDDLRPVLEKCLAADAVIVDSPVYHSYPTGMFRSFLERFMFPAHTYMKDGKGGVKRVLDKTLPVGVIMTMNCPEDLAEKINYLTVLDENENSLRHVFGYSETLYAYDTYQFTDYSKYDCDLFDEPHKARVRETDFPVYKQKAYEMAQRLLNITD